MVKGADLMFDTRACNRKDNYKNIPAVILNINCFHILLMLEQD